MSEAERIVSRVKDNLFTLLENQFPIEYQEHVIDVRNPTFNPPKQSDKKAQEKYFLEDATMNAQLRGDLIIKKGNEVILNDKNILIANIPYPTERGTYIVKGNEKVFISQMLLRPGVYVKPERTLNKEQVIESEVRAGKKRFTIIYNKSKSDIFIQDLGMDFGYGGKKIGLVPFLLFMGIPESKIHEAIGNKDISEHLVKTAEKMTPSRIHECFFDTAEPETEEGIREKINAYLEGVLKFDEKALKVQEAVIGKGYPSFTPDAFLQTLKQMVQESEQPGSTTNIDDMRFKRVLSGEDTIARSVESGIFEWTKKVKERIRRNSIKSSNVKPSTYIEKEVMALANSSLSEQVSSSNPLDLAQLKNKVTLSGPGGLSKDSVKESNRNLVENEFGKIDPIETPQSHQLGVAQHLAQGVDVRNGEIYSKFYRVKDGVIDTSKIIDDIETFDEHEEVIAFYNPEIIDEKGGKKFFSEKTVRARHRGDFIDVPKEKVTLVDYKPDAMLGQAAALVPFATHNDGSRMLMGASMQRQALPLENAEPPLVQTVNDSSTGKTTEEVLAEKNSQLLRSPVNGEVVRIANDFIEIKSSDGTSVKVDKLSYFSPGKSGSYINHKPVVKVGDKVKKGDLLADGWQSKNGKLALGKNTIVAYMPFEGYNMEDGLVVSESWAEKMSSEVVKTLSYTVEYNEETFPPEATKDALKRIMVSTGVLDKLDGNGVIKKGENITAGDILVGVATKRNKSELSLSERIIQRSSIDDATNSISNKSKYARGYQRGKVIDVQTSMKGDEMKVVIKLLTFKPLGEGDKLTGRHGNKGTVSKVLPDDEMPRTQDGNPVEVIFSPLAVPSRKNLGQLLEVNAGLVAMKKGLPSYNVQNFDPRVRKQLMKDLEEIGLPDGKQVLINPKTNKPYENEVTVGPAYIMRLDHDAEKKIAASSFAAEDPVTGLPRKISGAIDGERTSPQTVGGMEFWALTTAGAVNNIHEMTTLKSDGVGSPEDKKSRMDIFNAIKNGEPIPEPVTPKTLKVLQDKLLATGVQIVPLKDGKETSIDSKFTELMIQPMKHESAEKLGATEVKVAKTFDARTKEEDPNGLYSKEVFGDKGDKWGKISFETPIPNPLYLKNEAIPYEAMLQTKGLKQSQIRKIVSEGYFVVTDPGDSGLKPYEIVDVEKAEELIDIDESTVKLETGPTALATLLKDVDLKAELRVAEAGLKELSNKPGDIKERSRLEKHTKMLSRALDQGYEPKDFMLPYVPVLPVKYRQPVAAGKGTLVEDGVTLLYQQLMKKNNEYQKALESYGNDKTMIDKQALADIEKDRYEALENIIGTKTFVDSTRGQEMEGIMKSLSQKKGFIRNKMQGKTQNYSGRSVIIVDPKLEIDEVGLPEDLASTIMKPHILRELRKQRFSAKEITKIMEERNADFRRALEKVAEEEVVILNRQPSLHKHSIQAFKPKIRWDEDGKKAKAISLNAIVTTGFNADFDGDSMAVHLPITEAAKKEAKELMMPSKNLINPTNHGLIMEIKHEMQLGIYYLTRDKQPQGKPKVYKTYDDLYAAYTAGEVKTYDAATVESVPGKGSVTATAGMHVFNSILPPAFIDYTRKNVKKKDIEKIVFAIIEDDKYGSSVAAKLLDSMKTVGFKASTMSAISIGVRDFDPIMNVDKDKLFAEADKEVRKNTNVADFIDKKEAFEQAKADYVKGKLETMLKDGALGEDNQLNITLQSGARGKADQLSAMGGVVGNMRNVSGDKLRPMKRSLLDGSRPDEFWDLSNDSRKGIFDRSVATSGPGALSRRLWTSNKQTLITERDCGDTTGIILDLNRPSDKKGLFGRVLLEDVRLKNGGVIKKKKNMPLSPSEVEEIRKHAVNPSSIRVRSPLSCKSADGLCQNCYGMKPGAMRVELVAIGEPVGSIASQAIGEPAQQSIMKTFHTGGGGVTGNLANAFDATSDILDLKTPANKAVLVEKDGVVTEIRVDPIKGTKVYVDKRGYDIKKLPINDIIKVGVSVKRGDSLTKLKDASGNNLTVIDPKDVLAIQGVQAARSYLTQQLEDSFVTGDISHIDRRHTEIVVSNMSNRARVKDGGTSGLLPTSEFELKKLEAFNAEKSTVTNASLDWSNRINVIGARAAETYHEGIGNFGKVLVKEGEEITEDVWMKLKEKRKFIKVHKRNAVFTPKLQGINQDNSLYNDNWLDNAGTQSARRFISAGSAEFAKDSLDNPFTRQMTGLKGNFGTGFKDWSSNIKREFGDMLV